MSVLGGFLVHKSASGMDRLEGKRERMINITDGLLLLPRSFLFLMVSVSLHFNVGERFRC